MFVWMYRDNIVNSFMAMASVIDNKSFIKQKLPNYPQENERTWITLHLFLEIKFVVKNSKFNWFHW